GPSTGAGNRAPGSNGRTASPTAPSARRTRGSDRWWDRRSRRAAPRRRAPRRPPRAQRPSRSSRRRLPRRLLRLLEGGRLQPGRVEQPADDRLLRVVACERAGERAQETERVLVDRRLHELPHVWELEPPAAVVQRLAHRVEPFEQRLDRLHLEPAVDAPVAER